MTNLDGQPPGLSIVARVADSRGMDQARLGPAPERTPIILYFFAKHRIVP
ncbi:MAG: hypothetical protein NVSMB9_00970 [Isosphaeraceae bacterium]